MLHRWVMRLLPALDQADFDEFGTNLAESALPGELLNEHLELT